MVQLGDLIITASQELRDQLSCRKTIRGKAALCRRLRPTTGELRRPGHAAKLALRSIARRIDALDDEIAVLDRQLERLVRAAAPRTTQLLEISTGTPGNCWSPPGRTSTLGPRHDHRTLATCAHPVARCFRADEIATWRCHVSRLGRAVSTGSSTTPARSKPRLPLPFFDVELGLALFAGQTPMTHLGVG
jgi:hypothetical protein